jgi:hypothetical protein
MLESHALPLCDYRAISRKSHPWRKKARRAIMPGGPCFLLEPKIGVEPTTC